MKLNNAKIDIFVNKEFVEINLHDSLSGLNFCQIKMTSEQFCAAIGRLSYAPVESMEINSLDKIGKVMEIKTLEFPIDFGEHSYKDRQEKAIQQSKKFIPDGWQADNYFNSQNSFFNKDGEDYARVTIRRWI